MLTDAEALDVRKWVDRADTDTDGEELGDGSCVGSTEALGEGDNDGYSVSHADREGEPDTDGEEDGDGDAADEAVALTEADEVSVRLCVSVVGLVGAAD